MPGGERRRSTYTMTPSIEPCLDGYVGMATITMAQWKTFLEMIERPDLADDESLQPLPNRRRPDVLKAITDWTGRAHRRRGRADRVDVPDPDGAPRQRSDLSPPRAGGEARALRPTRGGFPHPRPPFRSNATERRSPGPPRRSRNAGPGRQQRPGRGSWRRHGRDPSMPGRSRAGRDGRDRRRRTHAAVSRSSAYGCSTSPPSWPVRCARSTWPASEPTSSRWNRLQRPDPMRFSVLVDASVEQWYEQGAIYPVGKPEQAQRDPGSLGSAGAATSHSALPPPPMW